LSFLYLQEKTVAVIAGVDRYRAYEKAIQGKKQRNTCKTCKESASIVKTMHDEIKELQGFCQVYFLALLFNY